MKVASYKHFDKVVLFGYVEGLCFDMRSADRIRSTGSLMLGEQWSKCGAR